MVLDSLFDYFKNMKNKLYLCIHGHFYQPPRENPWTDQIEVQPSAAPYHDWNERIAVESYIPNGASKVLDSDGRITRIVNNYEFMNFNFGPTLLSWMKDKFPVGYKRIIDGDKASCKKNGGHGNAIAQVYNHIIMPLASRRDKLTQIRWGKIDFKAHFDREPESMWLAETAVNTETIECLIEENIKYLILSPTQAETIINDAVKNGSGDIIDVGNGNVDSTRAYRCYLYKGDKRINDKYIDIFFYDGAFATAVSFNHLLRNSDDFLNTVLAKRIEDRHDQLVHVATDGESYGHHEKFGDMCLAAMFSGSAAEKDIEIINYGYFLEKFPPKSEVLLKNASGEGTAWSCAHGVGRWQRDCGCQTGGMAEWNQKWRKPLRQSFDKVKEQLDTVFVEEGKSLFKDTWAARDNYIHVIRNRTKEEINTFLNKNLLDNVKDDKSRQKAFSLLEMQYNSLLSFTSCAWFFCDISGIETVQNMRYAYRAIELAKDYFGNSLLSTFLSRLDSAISNVDKQTGKDIFNIEVPSSVFKLEKAIAFFAIKSAIVSAKNIKENNIQYLFNYILDVKNLKFKELENGSKVLYGMLDSESLISLTKRTYALCAFHFADGSNSIFVSDVYPEHKISDLEIHINDINITTKAEQLFNVSPIKIKDFPTDQRHEIAELMLEKRTSQIISEYETIFNHTQDVLNCYKNIEVDIPEYLRIPCEYVISNSIKVELESDNSLLSDSLFSSLNDLLNTAKGYNFIINSAQLTKTVNNIAFKVLDSLNDSFIVDKCARIIKLLDLIELHNIEYNKTFVQNFLNDLVKNNLDKKSKDSDIKLLNKLIYNFMKL